VKDQAKTDVSENNLHPSVIKLRCKSSSMPILCPSKKNVKFEARKDVSKTKSQPNVTRIVRHKTL
jgi:hypothetical protein